MWSPAYTLRGGATEILRGVIAKGMGFGDVSAGPTLADSVRSSGQRPGPDVRNLPLMASCRGPVAHSGRCCRPDPGGLPERSRARVELLDGQTAWYSTVWSAAFRGREAEHLVWRRDTAASPCWSYRTRA